MSTAAAERLTCRQPVIDGGDLGDVGRPAHRLYGVVVQRADVGVVQAADRYDGQGDHDRRDRGEGKCGVERAAAKATAAAGHPGERRRRAGGQEQGDHAAQVVGLAPGGDEDHRQDKVGPAERAAPAQAAVAEQPHEAGDPHRRKVGADEHELVGHKEPARLGCPRTAGRDRVGDGELGPTVLRLPDEVGRPHEAGEKRARPEPRRGQQAPRTGQREAGKHTDGKEGDEVLVEQGDARDHAGQKKETLVAGAQDAHDEKEQQRPEEQIEGRRPEQVGRGRQQGADRHRTSRQKLGRSAAAQLAAGQPREHDDRRRGKRGGQAQNDQRARRQIGQHAGQQRYERRQVRVAPGEVAAGDQKVQLVAVVAVAPGEGEQHGGDGDGQDTERSAGHRRQPLPRRLANVSRLSCENRPFRHASHLPAPTR